MAKISDNVVSDLDTKTTAEKTEIPVASEKSSGGESTKSFVYIGPSLPNARLDTNTTICGTKKEITEYYKDAVERFPNVEKLIVPVERLAESRAKIRSGGNVLSKYYNDLLNQIKQKGAVE